jgi:hypothetical protein
MPDDASVPFPVYRFVEMHGIRLVDPARTRMLRLRGPSALLWDLLARGVPLTDAVARCAILVGHAPAIVERWARVCMRRWARDGWLTMEAQDG